MPTTFTGPLIPSQNFKITLPDGAYVNDAGEVVADMSGNPGGPIAATTLSASGAVTFDDTLDVAGAVVLTDTLDVGGATGLGVANITSANIGTADVNTSLIVTGATVVGLEDSFTVCGVSIFGDAAAVYVGSPFAGAVVKVQSVVNGEALTTGGETVVIGLGVPGTPMTDGTITIATLSAIGDLDVCNPSALNTVSVGSVISIDPAGTNASEGSTVNLTFTIRRSA